MLRRSGSAVIRRTHSVSKAGRGGTDFSPSPYDHGGGTPPDDLLPLIQCGLQLSVFCQIQGDCCASVTAFAETCWYNACVVGQDDLLGAGGMRGITYCRQSIAK
jgi:hypothetical protein